MSFYDIRDEKIFIAAIQRMLRDINYLTFDDPSTGITGIYDDATRHSVMSFQKDMDLSRSGTVDFETWEVLNSVHASALYDRAVPRAVYLFPRHSPYDFTPDTKDDLVFVIQYMLREVSKNGGSGADLTLTGIFDEATRSAVIDFKRRNLLDDNYILDTEALNRLFDEYEDIISSDK